MKNHILDFSVPGSLKYDLEPLWVKSGGREKVEREPVLIQIVHRQKEAQSRVSGRGKPPRKKSLDKAKLGPDHKKLEGDTSSSEPPGQRAVTRRVGDWEGDTLILCILGALGSDEDRKYGPRYTWMVSNKTSRWSNLLMPKFVQLKHIVLTL